MKKFTKDHEWIVVEGDIGTVGITDHAQDALGDIVFVELPAVGANFKQGDSAAVAESVKAAGDVKSPVSGEVVEANEALSDDSGLVNSDPEGAAWIFKIRLSNPAELDGLMDDAAYQAYLAE